MKNMNEMLEEFVQAVAYKMGLKYDVTAQLTWTDTFGPTTRKVENTSDHKGGAYYVARGILHEDTAGHKAVFTVSLPKDDIEDYITEWFKIEVKNLNWDGDGFRHSEPRYHLPDPASMDASELETIIKMVKASENIAEDFRQILEETKSVEHKKAMDEFGLQ